MDNNHLRIWLLLLVVVGLVIWGFNSGTAPVPTDTPSPSATFLPNATVSPTPSLDLFVSAPKANQTVKFPLIITGEVRGLGWNGFEGQVGTVALYNAYGEKVIGPAPLTTITDWMQLPTSFSVTIGDKDTIKQVKTETGYLLFRNENPSGDPERDYEYRVPVKFDLSSLAKQKVSLFYYNTNKDPSTQCIESAILPVEREIPVTASPVRDTVNLLIQGRLSGAEKSAGFATEFPLEGFSLKSANLKSGGMLTLEFADPLNKTGGGACQVSLLRWQIEKTALQFPNVKTVKIIPDYLFQP